MPVQQVRPDDHFPSGDSQALATLRFSPEALAERHGLTFEEDNDDLDWFQLAAMALPDGSRAWLMRHQGNPEPGTIVYVDAGAELATAKAHLTRALGLREEDFSWVAPELVVPVASA